MSKYFENKISRLLEQKFHPDFKLVDNSNLYQKLEYTKRIPVTFQNYAKSGTLFIYIYRYSHDGSYLFPPDEEIVKEDHKKNFVLFITIKNKKQIDSVINISENIENIYKNTIGIHYQKMTIMEEVLNKCLANDEIQTYLHIYFANMVDLMFYFNSYLLNYCFINNLITQKSFISHKDNENNFTNLLLLAQEHKKIENNKKYNALINKIRIYEVFFRNSYAHGKIINTIQTLLFDKPGFVLTKKDLRITSEKDCPNKDRLRIALFKEDLIKFLKYTGNTKLVKNKSFTRWNKTQNQKHTIYLLKENESRMYLNAHSLDNLTAFPATLKYLHKSFFMNEHSNNISINIYVLNNEKKKEFSHTLVTYESIKNEIEEIISFLQ